MVGLQLNLLPDVKKQYIKSKMQRNLVIFAAIIISSVSGGVVALLFILISGQVVQKKFLNDDIQKKYQEISSTKNINSYLTLQNQLKQLKTLKTAQPQYSRLFDYLQRVVPPLDNGKGIAISQVSLGDGAGSSSSTTSAPGAAATTIQLQGQADSFETLAVFKTILSKTTIAYSRGADGKVNKPVPLFAAVADASTPSYAGASGSGSGSGGGSLAVSFSLTLTFDPTLFAFDLANVEISTPSTVVSNSTANVPTFTAAPKDPSADNRAANGDSDSNSSTEAGNE